jgi:O-antigen/teichoic acid export membrane protein
MSGQQQRMVRAQAIAVPVGIAINWALIPHLGLIGAATAAAVTNSLLNLLWLRAVNRTLTLYPSHRGYLALLLPGFTTLAVISLVRYGLRAVHHDFLVVVAGLGAGYAVFLLSALAVGLNASDKMLARSAWDLMRRTFWTNVA